ncbi:hypothetical protein GCM10020331_069740 [Ectobacillus funiculus]
MLSDTFPGQEHSIGTNVTIALMPNDIEKQKKYLKKIARWRPSQITAATNILESIIRTSS